VDRCISLLLLLRRLLVAGEALRTMLGGEERRRG
jgi:hypothetical protein